SASWASGLLPMARRWRRWLSRRSIPLSRRNPSPSSPSTAFPPIRGPAGGSAAAFGDDVEVTTVSPLGERSDDQSLPSAGSNGRRLKNNLLEGRRRDHCSGDDLLNKSWEKDPVFS